MLDIKLITEKYSDVLNGLNKRGGDYDDILSEIVQADRCKKELTAQFEKARSEQIKKSKDIGKAGAQISQDVKGELGELAKSVKNLEAKMTEAKALYDDLMLEIPNLPDDDIVAGGKENNVVYKEYGRAPEKDFNVKDHSSLATSIGLVDFERGVKIAGSGNWMYRGDGALMEWGLLNYFISTHVGDGYEFILPPHILNNASGVGAGQFPKFKDEVFLISNVTNASGDSQFMLPTSETALVNIYRDEILQKEQLPIKLFAYSPCYRREAGSYRAEERGTVRGHQFNKVEMFQFTAPEDSARAFEELVEKASKLVDGLGLHFRVSKLAAGDISASMRRTYDIEVLIPSLGYKEVSSVSNAGCYQARRANIKYRDSTDSKPKFVHTLNGSGLATSRLIPAILEQYQNSDGSVTVPEVLRPWMNKDKLVLRK